MYVIVTEIIIVFYYVYGKGSMFGYALCKF